MLEIALEDSENGVYQKDISERQDISVKYLDSIITALKTAGLIVNARGKKSGYKLTRKPDKVKIIDIHNAFEPGVVIVDCLGDKYKCHRASTCSVKDFWEGLNTTITNYLESYTLADLIRETKRRE
jgi:Rrf2 family protein